MTTIWYFPDHPWDEERELLWKGVVGDKELLCTTPGGRRRKVTWEDGEPTFDLFDARTKRTWHLVGVEL